MSASEASSQVGQSEIRRIAAGEAFSGLDDEVLEALLARGRVRSLQPGEVLFHLGDPDRDLLYIVYEGRVDLIDAQSVVTSQEPVALLALSSYFDDEPYTLTARAARPTQVIEVPFDDVRALEQDHPALADTLSRIIADRIRANSWQHRGSPTGALSQQARSVMTTPLTYRQPDCTLAEAFALMDERRIGSLAVLDEAGGLIGLATIRTLARALFTRGLSPQASVAEAAERFTAITPDTPLSAAQEVQAREGVRYLVVMEGDRPVGMISQTNMLHAVLAQQTVMRERISRAASLEELRALAGEVSYVAREAWSNNREASRAAYLLSEYHLQLQRRCIDLALAELRDEGLGEPPRGYALIVLGSLARREGLINPDQDNAIIIADAPPGESAPRALDAAEARWFEAFTERVNTRLDELGYEWCKGGIMARNPEYRRRLAEWCEQVRAMAHHPGPKAARWGNIFFDFELLYGDEALVDGLWEASIAELEQHPRLLRFLAADDAEGQPAVGLFNRLIRSSRDDAKGRVDIKRKGLRIIGNGARIYALSAAVRETNTVARLKALRREGLLTGEMVDAVLAAYEELFDLLLTHQIEQHQRGETPDKYIDPAALDELTRQSLATSMRAVKRFQDRVQGVFGL
ncbi:putative nucleotidyltransferase substrate binding domain-containing protein [Halorhodospira neutriphila]|uniref:Cyclic nucleotide-binding protein n=1 Tax=Halorhodospira neutriphila TaxID=168379 RepID=A0ABS1E3K6_9GAMM|nr:putative nucleotidyltransferase substrate binding domain-containing protein [Halorhodospira neutriphila]MBK1726288.1 cyclic nucleotide-binding protein [Halorhodospira neutriphila]